MPDKHSGGTDCLFESALSGLERLVSNPKVLFEMVSSSSWLLQPQSKLERQHLGAISGEQNHLLFPV